MNWMPLIRSAIAALAPASPAPSPPPTLPTSSLTAGVSTLASVITALSAGLQNLPADEAAANDVMDLLAMIDPAARPAVAAIEGAEWLLPLLVGYLGALPRDAGDDPSSQWVPIRSRGR